jgi:hypothetical protein
MYLENLMWPPPHEPSPHPDPLPSHPMGAEREQQADTNCLIKVRRPESGSRVQCADFPGNFHLVPLPRGGEGVSSRRVRVRFWGAMHKSFRGKLFPNLNRRAELRDAQDCDSDALIKMWPPPHEPRKPMWPPHLVPLPRGGEGVVLMGEGVVLGCDAQILSGKTLPKS